jgi:hypothetical protein
MSVAVLADEGVELSLSVEIIEQILHKLRRRRIDGQLTSLVFGASSVDNHQHVRISLTARPTKAGEIIAWEVWSELNPDPSLAPGCTFLIRWKNVQVDKRDDHLYMVR